MDSMMRLVPLHDKLLVKPRQKKVMEKSGIIIPETSMAYARPEEGWVVAVNEGRDNRQPIIDAADKLLKEMGKISDSEHATERQAIATLLAGLNVFLPEKIEASPFREGELVFFTKHVGMSVEIEGERYLILGEDQIIGKISIERLTEEERGEFNACADADVSDGHGSSESVLPVSCTEAGVGAVSAVHGDTCVGEASSGSCDAECAGESREVAGFDEDRRGDNVE